VDALDLTLSERTHSSSAGLIRTQAWFSSGLNLAIVVFCLAIPDFPFDKRLLWVMAAYSLGYAVIAATVERVQPRMMRHLVSISTCAGVIGLAPIIHWSGGITSPFAAFYLVFLVSELVYGGGGRLSMACAIVSYFGVALAEAGGFLPVSSDLAARIYASPLTTFWILSSYAAFIIICATLTRIILAKLRRDVEREFHAKEGLLKQLADLDSCSQIGVLAHRVAHDLNSPIASALGSLDLMLMDKSAGTETREGLETARSSLLHMAALVKGINGYGRAQEDRGSRIRLDGFFTELAALVKFHPSSLGGKFFFDKEKLAPLSVRGSSKELRQIFFNLIKNGFEASAGLRHREVRLRAEPTGNGMLTLKISDSGPGIPDYERERMFLERFTTKKDGTGVGLLIVGELVKKNGGSISVGNVEGGGAEFSVTLPLFTEER
jgi:signal transduction histidine kinase